MAVVCCCPAQSGGVVWSVLCLARCVVVNTALVLSTVLLSWSVVWCGVNVSVCCSCGGVSSDHPPPHPPRGGGYRWWWGVCCGGGWHSVEGRVLRRVTLPSDVDVPRLVCSVAVLNGGAWCVLRCPVLGWVWRLVLSCSPLHTPPFGVFAVTSLLV